MFRPLILSAFLVLFATSAMAKVVTHTVDYSSGADKMQGYVAYDDAAKTPRPGIIIVHDWMGLGDFTKKKAEELAKQGYVAFAVDVYGVGQRPKDQTEAGVFATKYKGDRALLQAHMKAAYDALVGMKQVDANKIIATGYCFGGTSALELARSGAKLAGTASFHGGLANPTPENAKNITGAVLIMHGQDDPMVAPAEVAAFMDEMQKAHVGYHFVAYPNAVHAFTNPMAGNDPSKVMAYNAEADKASAADFQQFLKDNAPLKTAR